MLLLYNQDFAGRRNILIQEFTKLNAFIDSLGELKNFEATPQDYQDKKTSLNESYRDLVAKIDLGISMQDTTEKLKLFVHQAQLRLNEFAETAFAVYEDGFSSNQKLSKPQELMQELGTGIIDLMKKLRRDYPAFFDSNAALPRWIAHNDNYMATHKNYLSYALGAKGIEPRLLQIIESFADGLKNPGDFKIATWNQYDYFYELTGALQMFARQPKSEDDTLQLIKLLIGYNFNALIFYNFMLDYSEKLILMEFAYEEQELALMELLKIIEDVRTEHERGYKSNVLPISESVKGSINRQLDYIEKQKKLLMPFGDLEGKVPSSNFYFSSALNLQEYMFLWRISIESGFARVRRKSQIYAFVKNHIHTEKTKNPSPQYMRNLYSPARTIPPKAILAVRTWLVYLITYIDTHYINKPNKS